MDNFYEKIELYINKELKGKELIAFEKQLTQDANLTKEVNLQHKVSSALNYEFKYKKADAVLEEIFTKMGEKFGNKETPSIIPHRRKTRLRSILIMITSTAAVITMLLIWSPWRTLYQQYAMHPIASFATMGSTQQNLTAAATAFNKKDYLEASRLLALASKNNPQREDIRFFLGISYLETGQVQQAISVLTPLKSVNSSYNDDATWYIALAYLEQIQLDKCRNLLQQILESSSHYEHALKLLSKL